jgi:putative acetyltransferase
MIIRNETASDIEAIAAVTEAAFRTLQISRHTEQFIIDALRQAKVLTVSLVAEIDRQVVGHIAFSPVTIADGSANWYGMGPLSVLPQYQKQGIGRALVDAGLSALKALGGEGCALVGDPAFYRRFGFRNIPALTYPDIPQEYFMVLPLATRIPQGAVAFHAGFAARPSA